MAAEPTAATFRIDSVAMDDLCAIRSALSVLERGPVSLETAISHALMFAAEHLVATVTDPFNALLDGMTPAANV